MKKKTKKSVKRKHPMVHDTPPEVFQLVMMMGLALEEARQVINAQNDGNCLVSVLEALKQAQAFIEPKIKSH